MYNYEEERPKILTKDGIITLLKIRNKIETLYKTAGSFRLDKAISGLTGDNWLHLACIDFLEEIGEITEITRKDMDIPTQDRVYMRQF